MTKLAFTIEHEVGTPGMNTADWYVYGNKPDWSGDPCWGHFISLRDAISFASNALGKATSDVTVTVS